MSLNFLDVGWLDRVVQYLFSHRHRKIVSPLSFLRHILQTQMYQFIPRLPTKEAWNTRPFQTRLSSLKGIVDAMEEKKDLRFHFRGQLNFKDETVPPRIFSGCNELQDILQKMKWDASGIHTIYLYNLGYFIRG